ncbi:DUF4855 domain-containing protein [Paenibacillus sp. OSY-SE]|uniref:DUF4855 domain-containing protein n=1 Tax=Paenibacillus sp. OSY-SE TaxID=1196323 RepID=UPI0002DAC9CC|nr:DUF4855 domain-containing protein [Paenibacillus sp. OSY-SE]
MKMWKQGLSLLIAAFLMTSVLSPTASADYFPKDDEKSNHASNIALIYTGYYNPDNYDGVKVGDYNKDQFLPYVGYLNEQGVAEDYFFDTFLMLTTQSPYKGSLARYYDWVAGSKPGTLQDWKWAMDRMFEKGLQLDGLEEAVEQVGADLNDPGKKVNVYLTMPFPDPQCKDFGDFNGDGQVKNLESLDTRKELNRWYIDTMTDRFNQRSYKHLKLSGFYWLQEDLDTGVPGEKESVQYTAECLHQHNMRLGWIPLRDRQTENATFYIDDLKLVKYEGMKQAPDYAIKLTSAIPAMDVGAVWTPAVENKSEKDAQGQLVTVEAVFSSSEPSVIEITPEGTLKALQAGKAVIRAAVGNIEAESKVVEVSPWRFNQLKGADSIIEMDPGLKNPVIRDPLQGGKQYVVKDGSNIKVAHKYNERYDMWLVFDHFGANKLHSFYEWRLSPNEGKEVSPDLKRASSVLQGEGSDWIGP